MASEITAGDAGAVAWRIFGGGESPRTKTSSYALIDRVIQKHVAPDKQAAVVATIRGWFVDAGGYRWLRDEAKPEVARAILDGIEIPFTERAVWAVAAIDADVMQPAMETRWTKTETVAFKAALCEALADVSRRDQIMEPSRISGLTQQEAASARVPRDAIEKESPLWTFRHLEQHQTELVVFGLYPAVARLVDLAVALDGGNPRRAIESLEHPALQARAMLRMQESRASDEDGGCLDWIRRDSGDAVIAAAIFHVLRAAASAGMEESREEDTTGVASDPASGRGEADEQRDRDGKSLIEALVARLAGLEAPARVRWIGEMLSFSVRALGGGAKNDKPSVLEQLERACLSCAGELLVESASQELVDEFKAGLRRKPNHLWTGYLARVAWLIRDDASELASEIARDAVVSYETQVEEAANGGAVVGDWFAWRDRDWLEGLGSAVALSSVDLCDVEWASDRCRKLPLSAWDAEERYGDFIRAEPLAQQWFFLAFLAMAPRRELGRPVRPGTVRALAEALWRHTWFASEHMPGEAEASVPVEFAARMAVKFGEADDVWILEQTGAGRVGPRALWALLDQRGVRSCPPPETSKRDERIFRSELAGRASRRFESDDAFDLLTLQHWGRLWLGLEAVEQAEQTAVAIMGFPDRIRDRGCAILVLRLLGLAVRSGGLNRELGDRVTPLYNDLWSTYGSTAPEEEDDRRQIEEAFADSGLLRR